MSKTLLLADDSITIQKVVGIAFAGEDFRIVTVDNGNEALAKARELHPHVILADVVMPGKNGYELCEAIRADPGLKQTPVLLLAGTFEAFDEVRARAARADGHIAKPFESQALVKKVNELVAAAGGSELLEIAGAPDPTRNRGSAPERMAGQSSSSVDPRTSHPILRSATGPPPIVSRGMGPAPMGPSERMAGAVIGPTARTSAQEPGSAMQPSEGASALLPQRRSPGPATVPRHDAPPSASRLGADAGRERRLGTAPSAAEHPGRPIPELDWSDLGFSEAVGTSRNRPGTDVGRREPPEPTHPAYRDFTNDLGGHRDAPADRLELVSDDTEPLPLGEPIDISELQPDPPEVAAAVPYRGFDGTQAVAVVEGARITGIERSSGTASGTASEPGTTAGNAGRESGSKSGVLRPLNAFSGTGITGVGVDDVGSGFSGTESATPKEAAEPTGPAVARPFDGGEAQLRDALSRASREVIERIAWEIIPTLAETIIREHIDRLVKERGQ